MTWSWGLKGQKGFSENSEPSQTRSEYSENQRIGNSETRNIRILTFWWSDLSGYLTCLPARQGCLSFLNGLGVEKTEGVLLGSPSGESISLLV